MKEYQIDLKDYEESWQVRKRTAARGIVIKEGKYLIIHGKYGDYKFPGGGKKDGETLEETLIREVQEETGCFVIKKSIRSYCKVQERRKGDCNEILEMDSYYFFCETETKIGNRNLDDYEKEYNYQVAWLSLEDIIKKNEQVENFEKIPWIQRENMVMKALLEKKEW